ncbi:hypothetical protein B0T18DRAFT_398921 [Schizothecium vesticola]|uniref:Uncharacterized protein n=1 Tax=Schizothecium vesticola TaxID=314040 RepID=A0AA40FAL3_9PEZI|nr:hypothetical protein B0T18DRAFT_398921 [Schizothecium vesticola]
MRAWCALYGLCLRPPPQPQSVNHEQRVSSQPLVEGGGGEKSWMMGFRVLFQFHRIRRLMCTVTPHCYY